MPLKHWRSTLQIGLYLLILLPTCCLFPMTRTPASTAPSSPPTASAQPPLSPATPPSNDWRSEIQRDLERREYDITWRATSPAPGAWSGYQAPNRTLGARVGFDLDGVHLAPRTSEQADWRLSLRLSLSEQRQTGARTLSIKKNQATYRRPEWTECYTNDRRGLLQEIVTSTSTDPHFFITITLAGTLTPRLDEGVIHLTTETGETVLHYGPFQAIDAHGQAHAARAAIIPGDAGAAYAIQITVADPIPGPFTLRAHLAAPPPPADWIGAGEQESAGLGYALSTAGDVNGDGYADLVIGAPWYDGGQADAGAVFVYHGSATGLGDNPAWYVVGDQEGGRLGQALAAAGDVNGDGYADVACSDANDGGTVFIYHGSENGLSAEAAWALSSDLLGVENLGASIAPLGDVNGDGFADIAIGAPGREDTDDRGIVLIYHGGADGMTEVARVQGTQPGAQFGATIGRAWRVNGEGEGDTEGNGVYFAVGAPGYDGIAGTLTLTDTGQLYVYSAHITGTLAYTAVHATLTGQQAGTRLGAAFSAGDLNGDGYDDLIVGAPGYDALNDVTGSAVLTDVGRVLVYHGEPTDDITTITAEADWIASGDQAGAQFGASLAILGDTNGDGYADLIVGAPGHDDLQPVEGAACIYRGGPSGLRSTPVWTLEPTNQASANFGHAVAAAGDVNGDGYADIAVGAPGYAREQMDEGGAFVYHGGPAGLANAPAWQVTGDREKILLGWSVANAGDVNGDGYDDLLVGAPHYDGGLTEQGAVFLYTGGTGGPTTTPIWSAEGGQAWARLGQAIASAGDVNGDGYADVILGVPLYDHEMHDDGQVRVYYGGPEGPGGEPDWVAPPPSQGTAVYGISARFGYAVASAGDVNGDGYADVLITANGYDAEANNEGSAFVYYGGPDGLADEPAWVAHPTDQAFANFGRAVGRAVAAGDVNGDGFSDVIVGTPWHDVTPNLHSNVQDEGALYGFYGSAEGLSPTPNWVIIGDNDQAELGLSIAIGDVNGDGLADVVAGAYKYTGEVWREGAAFVYHGDEGGLADNPAWSIHPTDQENSKFAIAVAIAGDVDGDGFSEVVIGSSSYAVHPEGESKREPGGVFVYPSGPGGVASGAQPWTATGDQDKSAFGFSVAVGDWDGDGFADLAVGAPTYDSAPTYVGGHIDQGGVFIYPGNGGWGRSTRPMQMRTDGKTPIGPLGHSNSANSVHLQLAARRALASAPLALEWQIAPLGVPFTSTEASTDVSPFTSGDVLSQTVEGLTPNTVYRWRVRQRHPPGDLLGSTAGPWRSPPWNGPAEADFRTRP